MAELITVARPYAKAAFEWAQAQGQLAEWSAMLELAGEVSKDEALSSVVDNPSLTSEQKAELFTDICGDKLNEQGRNFVALLAEAKRLTLLPAISELFDQLKAAQERSVNVVVETAFDMNDAQQASLAQALAKKLDRSVNIEARTDKGLIGGVIVHAEDMVIDASVRGRLAKLAESLAS